MLENFMISRFRGIATATSDSYLSKLLKNLIPHTRIGFQNLFYYILNTLRRRIFSPHTFLVGG